MHLNILPRKRVKKECRAKFFGICAPPTYSASCVYLSQTDESIWTILYWKIVLGSGIDDLSDIFSLLLILSGLVYSTKNTGGGSFL